MKLGARILKTGLAVVAAYYVCGWLNLEPTLLVVVAAVLTTLPSVYLSIRFFIDQLQANTIGAVLGVAAAAALGNDPLAIGLAVIVVILINMVLKLESTISLSIVTVIAVMEEPDAAIIRFVLIMTGVVLATVINAAFMPPNHERLLMEKLGQIHQQMWQMLRAMTQGQMAESAVRKELQTFRAEWKKADDLFRTYKEERLLRRKVRRKKANHLVIYRHMLDILQLEQQLIHWLRRERTPERQRLLHEIVLELTHYHETILMKFEGKLKLKPHEPNGNLSEDMARLLAEWPVPTGRDGQSDVPVNNWMLIGTLTEVKERLHRLDKLITAVARRRA